MGKHLLAFWNHVSKSRYTRYLEDEVARLRERDQQTVNSLLSGMGLPQIGPRVTKPLAPVQGHMLPSQLRTRLETQDRKQIPQEDTDGARQS